MIPEEKDRINVSGSYNRDVGNRETHLHNLIGEMSGGIFHHSDEGKNQVIEKQEQQILQIFETFLTELRQFHEYIVRQDDYIKKQDDHLNNIVSKSYLRNERNMERIDKLIEQQNSLLKILNEQNEKTQDRADRLLALLEKKM
jgi:transcriptional antiterminator